MKITKQQLKQIIAEELERLHEVEETELLKSTAAIEQRITKVESELIALNIPPDTFTGLKLPYLQALEDLLRSLRDPASEEQAVTEGIGEKEQVMGTPAEKRVRGTLFNTIFRSNSELTQLVANLINTARNNPRLAWDVIEKILRAPKTPSSQ